MAYNNIDTIYETIRAIILGLKIVEAKEYFDFDIFLTVLQIILFVLARLSLIMVIQLKQHSRLLL